MAAGDVTVQLSDPNTAAVDTIVTAMRNSANDKWGFAKLDGGQIMIINVEEV